MPEKYRYTPQIFLRVIIQNYRKSRNYRNFQK